MSLTSSRTLSEAALYTQNINIGTNCMHTYTRPGSHEAINLHLSLLNLDIVYHAKILILSKTFMKVKMESNICVQI